MNKRVQNKEIEFFRLRQLKQHAFSFELNDEQILIFGWIHIGMFIFLMAGTLTIDIIKQILELKANCLRERRIKELRKMAMYYSNPFQKLIQAK